MIAPIVNGLASLGGSLLLSQPAAASSAAPPTATAVPSAASSAAALPPAAPTINVDSVWLPRAGSTIAGEIDYAFHAITYVSIGLFLLVVVPMFYFMWKYKRKSEDERTSPIDHNFRLEVIWSVIPSLFLVWFFVLGIRGYANASVPPNEATEIQVTAQMYNWNFTYPDGTVTQELGLAVGKPVRLTMSSRDVIHAFWVPEFRVKQDVVPGQYTTMWFTPTVETETAVECTEYCGDGHSKMLTTVFVMPEPKYEEWLANGGEMKPLPPAQRGAKKYNAICSSCHSLDGTKIQGPSFKGIYGRTEKFTDGTSAPVDDTYIRQSILEPQAKIVDGYPGTMPSFAGQLKEADIEGIIAFLKEQK